MWKNKKKEVEISKYIRIYNSMSEQHSPETAFVLHQQRRNRIFRGFYKNVFCAFWYGLIYDLCTCLFGYAHVSNFSFYYGVSLYLLFSRIYIYNFDVVYYYFLLYFIYFYLFFIFFIFG